MFLEKTTSEVINVLTKKDRTAVNQIEFVCIDSLVPENHLLRAVLESIDFSFIYDEVKDLYSETHGRPSVDPVVLIKLLILQALLVSVPCGRL